MRDGRTDKQTTEDRATQPLKSFAILILLPCVHFQIRGVLVKAIHSKSEKVCGFFLLFRLNKLASLEATLV